ncbi:MAG: hypothetical protein EA427_01770 [Spirochaetaceae bacterium]|nr:MAG: hypothetical protein EA427_01770 [Spirochaetaceae bacterium]
MNTGTIDSGFARYLLGLEDESFFALIRNYLGPVKTPYNKHELIANLVEFLSRDETRRRILELLDEEDRLVLRAVMLLGQPTEDNLHQFLLEELDFGHFHWLLTSLRDRLLLIDGHVPATVQVNPLLAEDLVRARINPDSLLAGELLDPQAESPGELPWFSPVLAACLYAFLREEPILYTRSGAIRKRAATALRERFGQLFSSDAGDRRLATALLALRTLGLIAPESEEKPVRIMHDGWDELAELPDNWIQALFWATLVSPSLERAFDMAPLLIEFARRLPRDRWFTGAEILRILRLTSFGTGIFFSRETPGTLTETGLLLPHGEGYRLNPAAADVLEIPRGTTTGAVLHASMEITLSPELSFRSLMDAAGIARLRRYDIMPVMEITEESIASARRIERENAPDTLRRITDMPLPQNAAFLLTRWAGRADAVRLVRGLVLRVDEEVAEILNSSPEFNALPRDTLAPGVFLFHPDRQDEVEHILEKMEFTAPGGLENLFSGTGEAPEFLRLYSRYQQPVLTWRPSVSFTDIPPHGDKIPPGTPVEDTLGELREALRNMDVPEELERELALRIERKLILFPHQIRTDLVPRHGVEARGLDYLGKLRIAEQAIAEGELLELIMRSAAGAPQRILVRPRELSESGDDLMLRAIQLPEGSPVRIRIRRASLVRRLSGTLLRRRSGR